MYNLPSPTINLGDYSQIWLELYHKQRVELTTYYGYVAEIKKLLKYAPLAEKPISAVTSVDIQNYIYYLTFSSYGTYKGKELYYSKASIKKAINVLKALFKFAEFNGDISRKPTASIYLPKDRDIKKETKVVTAYPLEDSQKIEEAVLQRKEFAQSGLAIVFLMETGLRIGELNALTVEDINFTTRQLTVNKQFAKENNKLVLKHYTKTKNGTRKVPLSKNAMQVLVELNRREGLLFRTKDNQPINRAYVTKVLRNMEERLNLQKRGGSLHCLRHTFASNCLTLKDQNGNYIPTKIISTWLGHASIETTLNIYAEVLAKREEEVSYELDNLYRS